MTLKLLMEVSPQELLIEKHGGTATLADIAADAKVHPAKVAELRRMMELLSASGIFNSTATRAGDDGATDDDTAATVQYGLTTAGRFLVGFRNISPMVPFCVNPLVVSSFFAMPDWLRSDAAAGSPFELAHGCSQWEMASKDAVFNHVLNDSMASDSELFLEVIIADKGRIFRGLSSLVDVGGGNGAAIRLIAKAFPRIKCTVLDRLHVATAAAAGDNNLSFVGGDMY